VSEVSATTDANDAAKLIQFTIENEGISSTQEFKLDLAANGISKFKCGDIQFQPGSSREAFIVNKAEQIGNSQKYQSVLKIWYGGVNKNLELVMTNRFPLKKVGTNVEFC
jgi:hypothetical protein